MNEILAKLYLELANVLPDEAKTRREIKLEAEAARLRERLADACARVIALVIAQKDQRIADLEAENARLREAVCAVDNYRRAAGSSMRQGSFYLVPAGLMDALRAARGEVE